MTKQQEKDLQKVFKQIAEEYERALANPYIYKPMAYTLYHLWQKWDRKEFKRIERGE